MGLLASLSAARGSAAPGLARVFIEPAVAASASGTLAPVAAAGALLRAFRTGVPVWMSAVEKVAVPPMGDSITEGAIAAILKAPGDTVEEDEVMVQIETDKVTIDVRAPGPGVVDKVMVAEDETVTVGQWVVSYTPSEGGMASKPAAPAGAPEVSAAAPAAKNSAHHRTPSIKFPPRVTEDGTRVSTLPAADVAAFLARHSAPAAAAASAAASPADVAAAAAAAAKPVRMRPPPMKRHPARRALSEAEMEIIMLGGADPY